MRAAAIIIIEAEFNNIAPHQSKVEEMIDKIILTGEYYIRNKKEEQREIRMRYTFKIHLYRILLTKLENN